MGFSYGGTGIIIVGVILNDFMRAVCSFLVPTRLFGAYSSAAINKKIPMDDMLPATKFKDMSRMDPPESCRICQDEFDGGDQYIGPLLKKPTWNFRGRENRTKRKKMADKEEASSGGDNVTRGTDWEVVSLTASAYAASPGPKPVDDDVTPPPYEAETTTTTSHPLYMSRHFAFPPSEEEQHHTDIPTEPSEKKMKMDSEFSIEQETGKEDGGDLTLKGLDLAKDDEFDFLQEGKGKSNIYMQDERAFGGEHSDPIQQQTDVAPPELEEEHHQVAAAANSPPPCEPWWKRSAASLISQAKETNTVWSIFIAAAAVMGVVVLGQRWQHDRWQVLQLNWESTIGNEKAAGRLMGPISRLKQAFVGGQRRDSFIRAAGSQNDS
ncbi:hypothetical protein HID58_010823 [Brassica napus]|uniref:Uncharacterized protein n=2 Tax=Brassica napus TaxID=3708 RepID=A0ABQ8DWE7_BRANA|nr:hypothetical protein HID58_010823 [Brassica napus]